MTHLFVPYEQALELKELGFDEPCLAYLKSNVLTYEITIGEFNEFEYHSAPTFSQAFKFFREKYDLDVISKPYIGKTKKYICDPVNIRLEAKNTYEEAENACLLELINICKKK